VVANQAKTTKVKNNFIHGKVQFRPKNLGEKVQEKSSNLS